MARGAPLTVLDDETSLNGPNLDVAVRIGWVLRMARLTPGSGAPTLEKMAARLGTSPSRLHRLETGRVRDGGLVDAYERVLERPNGSLRAPIDVMCRTFPSSPVDRDPSSPVTTVRAMSGLTDLVEGPEPTGGQWLGWARALAHRGALGMPERVVAPLVEKLISELNRSVSHGYPNRYEALALLRCSDYGYAVIDVARTRVDDPHVQVLHDMMSAVGEAITPDAVAWCLEMLEDGRDRVMIGGALALENMGQISTEPTFWRDLVVPLVTLFNASAPESARWVWLSHLLRLIPRPDLARSQVALARTLTPVAAIKDWSRSRVNAHWTHCQERAHAVTAAVGVPDQPLLARLLFDIAISHYETRAVTSYMLLGALPHLSGPLGEEVAGLAEHHADPVIRARAARRLPGMLPGGFPAAASRWLAEESPERRDVALILAGAAGVPPPDSTVAVALAGGESSIWAGLYAVGMSGSPMLPRLARDGSAGVRGSATWWLRQGGRVQDVVEATVSPGSG